MDIEEQNQRQQQADWKAPRINGVLEKVDPTQEQFSGITIDFFFSPHGDREDIQRLKEHIDAADAVAIEQLYWSEGFKDLFNFVSMANRDNPDDEQKLQEIYDACTDDGDSFNAELLRQIEGTNKPIIFPDIPQDHEFAETSKQLNAEALELDKKTWGQFIKGNYHEAIEAMKQSLSLRFQEQRMREKFIEKSLANQIKELKRGNPNFAKKKDLRVIIQYGSSHRTLFHDLRKTGVSTTQSSGYSLDTQGYGDEIKRKMYFGKEISEELYARNIFCGMYFAAIQRENPKINVEQATLLTRRSLDRLTAEDVKELSSKMGNAESAVEKSTTRDSFLTEKGAIIPNTDEEIRNLLGPLYNRYIQLGGKGVVQND